MFFQVFHQERTKEPEYFCSISGEADIVTAIVGESQQAIGREMIFRFTPQVES